MTEPPARLFTAFNLPPVEAIEYFEKKGYTPTWDWRELWQEAHHRAFTVAKVVNLDLLSDIRDEVDRSIREGASYSEFEERLLPSLKKHGWLPVDAEGWPTAEAAEIEGPGGKKARVGPWRLRTIYHTNMKVATQVGRFKQMTDPEVLRRRPYWQYISVLDRRTTLACRQRNGEVHHATDPWWSVNYPPNHWLCRAHVRSLSPRDLDSLGLRDKVTTNGGNIFEEAGKAGEGWGYNPGATAFKPDLSKYPEAWHKVFEPQGLPRKIDDLTDISVLLKDPRQKGLFGHREGMQSIEEEDAGDYLMATYSDGRLLVSTREVPDYGGLSPKERLIDALKKLGKEDLAFEEEAALRGLWHELLHNQQRVVGPTDRRTPGGKLHEVLTEWAARHTYGDLVEWLGLPRSALQFEESMPARWVGGYGPWVANFRRLVEGLGLGEGALVRPILRLYRMTPDRLTYLEPLARLLAGRSGRDVGGVREALKMLDETPEGFQSWIDRIQAAQSEKA